jgi:hypothetical protein
VTLVLHTVTYPGLSYSESEVLPLLRRHLREEGLAHAEELGVLRARHLPHLVLTGQHLDQREMLRLYR